MGDISAALVFRGYPRIITQIEGIPYRNLWRPANDTSTKLPASMASRVHSCRDYDRCTNHWFTLGNRCTEFPASSGNCSRQSLYPEPPGDRYCKNTMDDGQ